MDDLYFLKHKDDTVGILTIDKTNGTIATYKSYNSVLEPFLGNSDLDKIKLWWKGRAVPGSRQMMDHVIREAGCNSNYEYLAKNLALSITDNYWVCPGDVDLKWDNVNLFNITTEKGFIPYHNATSYDPNASLGGQMEKYWDLSQNVPQLIKTASGHFGQQAINEVNASAIYGMQHNDFPFVKYALQRRKSDNALQCVCDAFTSLSVEFIPAYEVVESKKIRNDLSMYDHFANICSEHGLDYSFVRDFLDYQTMMDFLISNTDEHLNNFGVLRDSNTLELLSVAPIFDSGNSMFYLENGIVPYTRVELLDRKVTATVDTEEKLLKTVKNRKLVDVLKLPDNHTIKEMYIMNGVPEAKAEFISGNYETKKIMLNEFIHGKTISLYNEKKKERVLSGDSEEVSSYIKKKGR